MLSDLLTRDNHHLSRPTKDVCNPLQQVERSRHKLLDLGTNSAVNRNNDLCRTVESYVRAGIATATRRAYRSDLEHFRAWGGDIPATEGQVATYLAEHAIELKVATLVRRLAAISVAHEALGLLNPAKSPLVRATLRGIRRERGCSQRQAKPLLKENLLLALDAMGEGANSDSIRPGIPI